MIVSVDANIFVADLIQTEVHHADNRADMVY